METRLSTLFYLTAIVLVFSGCTTTIEQPIQTLSGTFTGTSEDGQSVRLQLDKSVAGIAGYGSVDEDPITVSLLTGYQGQGVMTYDSRIRPVAVELSFDGEMLTFHALDSPVVLSRVVDEAGTSFGQFTGRFENTHTTGTVGVVELEQHGNLIVGTGSVYGMPIALSGQVESDAAFNGKMMFTDGSRAVTTGKLSDGNRKLTITGFGSPLEFSRKY